MGKLQLNQIGHRLNTDFVPQVDVSDLSAHGEEQVAVAALSRALAAFALAGLWDWQPSAACASITDHSGDNGIDLVAIDESHGPRVMLAQSKWSQDGTGSAALADMLKFKKGVEDVLHGRHENFEGPILLIWDDLQGRLLDPAVRIELLFAHSGSAAPADTVLGALDPVLHDLNEHQSVASHTYLSQNALHQMLLNDHAANIDLEVELSDYGIIEGRARAFYGHVAAQAVAEWGYEHGASLFSRNLRATLPSSAVNAGIAETVSSTPENLWYFNNGITALCNRVSKAPSGGSDRRVGHFTFSGVQVVNGAQTVGTISDVHTVTKQPVDDRARVMVRFIEVGESDDFARQVTRWTNTQNRVGGREFVALDPEQQRLVSEFGIDGLVYAVRSGELEPAPEDGCDLTEATVALACVKADLPIAVTAKREVSRLWADTSTAPYKALFNGSTTSHEIWRAVAVLRLVDDVLNELDGEFEGRSVNFLRSLNRAILWCVSREFGLQETLSAAEADWGTAIETARQGASDVARSVVRWADDNYPGYPANLAKNATECRRMAANLGYLPPPDLSALEK